MAEEIKCNTSTLATDNNDVMGHIKQIRASEEQLRNILSRLDSMWDGEASEAFKVRMQEQLAQLEQYCVSLDSIAQYEGKAVSEYEKCERDIGGIISSISI